MPFALARVPSFRGWGPHAWFLLFLLQHVSWLDMVSGCGCGEHLLQGEEEATSYMFSSFVCFCLCMAHVLSYL